MIYLVNTVIFYIAMAMSLEGKTVDSYHTWGLDRLNFAENAQVFQSFDFEIFLDHYILKQANTKFKTRFDHHQLNFKLCRIQNIAEHFFENINWCSQPQKWVGKPRDCDWLWLRELNHRFIVLRLKWDIPVYGIYMITHVYTLYYPN